MGHNHHTPTIDHEWGLGGPISRRLVSEVGTCEGLCPWCGVLHAAASFCTSFSGSRLPPLVAHLLRAASLMAAAGVDALHGTLH